MKKDFGERWNVMRLTVGKVLEILKEHEGFEQKVPQYGGNITRYYFIKDGKLFFHEAGKLNWSDSRFDTRVDGVPWEATIEQARNFIKKYIL